MDFAISNLSVLAYVQGFTQWHYRARGVLLADVAAPGFFDPCADMIEPGDMIMVSATDGGAVHFVHISDKSTGRTVVAAMVTT